MGADNTEEKVLNLTQVKNRKLFFILLAIAILVLIAAHLIGNGLYIAIPLSLLVLLYVYLIIYTPHLIIFDSTGMRVSPDYFRRNEFTWDEIEKIEKNKTAVGPYLDIHLKNGDIRKIGLFVTPYKDRNFTLTEFAALAEEMGVNIDGIPTGS